MQKLSHAQDESNVCLSAQQLFGAAANKLQNFWKSPLRLVKSGTHTRPERQESFKIKAHSSGTCQKYVLIAECMMADALVDATHKCDATLCSCHVPTFLIRIDGSSC